METDYTKHPAYSLAMAFDVDAYFARHSELPQTILHALARGTEIDYPYPDGSRRKVVATGKIMERPQTAPLAYWENGQMWADLTLMCSTYDDEQVETISNEVNARLSNWQNDLEIMLQITHEPKEVYKMSIANKLDSFNIETLKKRIEGFAMVKEKGYPFANIQLFAAVKFIQWAAVQIDGLSQSDPEGKWPLGFKICLLHELGFFGLDKITKIGFTTRERDNLISNLLNADESHTRKNLNAWAKPTATHNPKKHLEDVKTMLSKILKGF